MNENYLILRPNEQASLNANIQQELKSQVGLLKSMLENKSKKLEETTVSLNIVASF